MLPADSSELKRKKKEWGESMKIAGFSDKGLVRANNEDSYGYKLREDGILLAVVCDGIGGSNAGDVASKCAVDTILKDFDLAPYFETPREASEWIKNEIDHCNDVIYKLASSNRDYYGMGTTLVGVLMNEKMTLIINVGDSRVYGLFDRMVCLTQDHNLFQELLHAGQLTSEEIKKQPSKHVLTNALGVYDKAKVDIGLANNDYDCLLLCSDGLHGYVDEEIIRNVLIQNKSVEEKAALLIQASVIAGGYDNASVIVIEKEVEAND